MILGLRHRHTISIIPSKNVTPRSTIRKAAILKDDNGWDSNHSENCPDVDSVQKDGKSDKDDYEDGKDEKHDKDD